MSKTLDLLNKVYEKHKDSFDSGFHSTLWRLLVDEIFKGKNVAFVCNYVANGLQLGVATENEAGYWPSITYFLDENFDNAMDIVDALNVEVFNIDHNRAFKIMASSMKQG